MNNITLELLKEQKEVMKSLRGLENKVAESLICDFDEIVYAEIKEIKIQDDYGSPVILRAATDKDKLELITEEWEDFKEKLLQVLDIESHEVGRPIEIGAPKIDIHKFAEELAFFSAGKGAI
jgi:phosphoenolpyruvate-protein kinase (PTS system EI component)